jgi:hypothetical protein
METDISGRTKMDSNALKYIKLIKNAIFLLSLISTNLDNALRIIYITNKENTNPIE